MKIKTTTSDNKRAIDMLNKKDTSRLTVDIDAEIHLKFKAKCALNGNKMNEAVELLILEWLD